MEIPFYDDYFSLPQFSADNAALAYKDKYVRQKATTGYIYKFIPFTADLNLNDAKMQILREKKLWVSNYKSFKDKNELSMTYNLHKASRKTGATIQYLRFLIDTTNQVNDVSCFTYTMSDFMWKNYANDYNGFCLSFLLYDSDKFFPVVYLRKQAVNFTNDLIYVLRHQGTPNVVGSTLSRLAILPWVLKDDHFSVENELRFLCGDIYDEEDDPMGGRIWTGKKEAMGYRGTAYEYSYCGIKLEQIFIGKNCDQKYIQQLNGMQYGLADRQSAFHSRQ